MAVKTKLTCKQKYTVIFTVVMLLYYWYVINHGAAFKMLPILFYVIFANMTIPKDSLSRGSSINEN